MSNLFDPRAQGDSWFRIGRFDVTSTLVVVGIGVLGMLVCLFVPSAGIGMYFDTTSILQGQLWRIVTWPLANFVSIWTLLTFLMLWYFGTMLESETGRDRMMRLYLEIWGALTVATFLVGLVLPGSTALIGLDQIQFIVLLLWIAEYPTRKFFFGIPAWGVGAFFVGLQVLMMLAAQNWGGLLAMLLGFVLVALAARRLGLLSAYPWLPGGRTRRTRVRPRPGRPSKQQQRKVSDEERMDQLLAKISAEGIHSLTKKERAELEQLRQRRRR